MTGPKRYNYDRAERMILIEFGEKLRIGEHVFIGEEDSQLYFRKSIRDANTSVIDLDKGPIPGSQVSPTVQRHMAQRGFSCRIGTRNGMKYVELWFPKKRIQEEEY